MRQAQSKVHATSEETNMLDKNISQSNRLLLLLRQPLGYKYIITCTKRSTSGNTEMIA